MVCNCGRTFEQHKRIELVSEKWREKNANGETNIVEMFRDIDECLIINSPPTKNN